MNRVSKFLRGLIVSVGLASSSAHALPTPDFVTIGSNQWAQLTQFTNLSWYGINAECPAGACGTGATLKGYDLNGWRWASSTQVRQSLFGTLAESIFFDPYGYEEETPPETLFNVTPWKPTDVAENPFVSMRMLDGWVSDPVIPYLPDPSILLGSVFSIKDSETRNVTILGSVNDGVSVGKVEPEAISTNLGAWFFRAVPPPPTPPANVPEPATLSLIGLAIAGLGMFRSRKS